MAVTGGNGNTKVEFRNCAPFKTVRQKLMVK